MQPATLALAPGETGTFRLTVTRTTAPLVGDVGGSLAWRDAGQRPARRPAGAGRLVSRPARILRGL